MAHPDTKQIIMQIARKTVQAQGYNALSFRELAKEVGIKSASIHYHFPTKSDLAVALARAYTQEATDYLQSAFEASQDPATLMANFASCFRSALENDNRMCLCGIMAAEHHDLPVNVRDAVNEFTQTSIQWIAQVLALRTPDAAPELLKRRAGSIFAAIQGAQLVARGSNDISMFDDTLEAYRNAGLIP
ncbi:TetR/AcrR family transcriptional regulator [Pseudomonas sp. NA-150]|uniref:TetR/AcrR family transcriptional regulator n=1 Tax=Pseudomonas sp. NA-150 TaxID=3367525 RepID=UPI0037C97591